MRGLRSFIALLVIALGLGAYLYFVESKRTPGDDAPARDKLFSVDASAIDEVTIKSDTGERTTVRKEGSDWRIVSPAVASTDPTEISGLTSGLAGLEIQRVVDEQPSDLKQYGLDPARIEVTFKGGGQEHTLFLGLKTPPGSDLYARIDGEKKVVLVPVHVESTFNRKPFDLRDKTVLRVERDKIETIEIAARGRSLTLKKNDAEWELTAPVSGPADFSTVNGLVGRLVSSQMKSVVPPGQADASRYGFDKPSATVRVGSGSSTAVLVVGAPAGEGELYARDESRPDVFTVESSLLDDLTKDASEYRQKDLFDARAFNATRMEIVRGGQTTAFERGKTKDKDGREIEAWRQVLPSPKDVDSAKVESLLSAVTAARAESFEDDSAKSGLAKPELTITIKFDDGKKEDRVSFARTSGGVFAGSAGTTGAARIDAATLDGIIKALEDIK